MWEEPGITVADLIRGDDVYALWHGTKADINGSLMIGSDVVGEYQNVIEEVWEVICAHRNIGLGDVRSEDVMNFFSHPKSRDNAVLIGNSIRYLRRDFDYSVIAFAFNRFAAHDYAKHGSELANAILALTESAVLEYPHLFHTASLSGRIQEAQDAARKLVSGKGKILKLIQMPHQGFFCTNPNATEEVMQLGRPPFPDRIMFTELFFKGEIPLGHFIIEEIE